MSRQRKPAAHTQRVKSKAAKAQKRRNRWLKDSRSQKYSKTANTPLNVALLQLLSKPASAKNIIPFDVIRQRKIG